MDYNDIKNQVQNLTLSDLKVGWRKAQNAVMNYTEMESKVREATNNEPWGTSSTAMQEIANGTFNYAQLSEIMPMIYKRFTEKSAEEWRQIYKALQLLEFLIKNGSERVIDDARSHMSLIKMLRQFHYIDQNGKDQGINIRNRSKELTELLSDVDRIRGERKKARSTRNKYGGSEGGLGMGPSSSGGRYGGFGSEGPGSAGYGGFSGGVYGDGGGFGGQESADSYGTSQGRRDRFDEYDEYDEGGATSPAPRRNPPNRTTPSAPAAPPKPKAPEVDLFEFGDDDIAPAPVVQPPTSNGKAAAPSALAGFGAMQASGGDDDFDDFQQATPVLPPKPIAAPGILAPSQPTVNNTVVPTPPAVSSTSAIPLMSPPPSGPARPNSAANYGAFNAPAPVSAPTSSTSIQSSPMQPTNQSKPSGYQPQGPNYFASVATSTTSTSGASTSLAGTGGMASGIGGPNKQTGTQATKKVASGSDPFAGLAMGGPKKPAQKGPSMAQMTKQQADQALWGAPAQQNSSGGSGGDLI